MESAKYEFSSDSATTSIKHTFNSSRLWGTCMYFVFFLQSCGYTLKGIEEEMKLAIETIKRSGE